MMVAVSPCDLATDTFRASQFSAPGRLHDVVTWDQLSELTVGWSWGHAPGGSLNSGFVVHGPSNHRPFGGASLISKLRSSVIARPRRALPWGHRCVSSSLRARTH